MRLWLKPNVPDGYQFEGDKIDLKEKINIFLNKFIFFRHSMHSILWFNSDSRSKIIQTKNSTDAKNVQRTVDTHL